MVGLAFCAIKCQQLEGPNEFLPSFSCLCNSFPTLSILQLVQLVYILVFIVSVVLAIANSGAEEVLLFGLSLNFPAICTG